MIIIILKAINHVRHVLGGFVIFKTQCTIGDGGIIYVCCSVSRSEEKKGC